MGTFTGHDWQIYLLAVDLLALAALGLGLVSFVPQGRSDRLFPLILLVMGRSLALVISLAQMSQAPFIIDALEVWNTFCLVWALLGSTARLPARWRELMPIGGAIAIFLSFLPLLPVWPIPAQLNSLLIAMAGTSLIYLARGEARWTHLTPPLGLGLAALLALAGLTSVSWLVTLLAYAVFIAAMHWEGVQIYLEGLRLYQARQQEAQALAQEAENRDRERQRLIESRDLLSNVPSLSQAMEHIVRSMARLIHVDQSAIFMLDIKAMGLAHVITVYSPERPVHITSRDDTVFELEECPALQEAIEGQQQLILPQHNTNGLAQLYGLWQEERTGPTLIQPLTLQGRPVGVLVLGNPVTQRPIAERDARLCQDLAPQIALMVEQRRRYLELELQAEAMAASVQLQRGRSEPAANLELDPVPELAVAEPEPVFELAAKPLAEVTTVNNSAAPLADWLTPVEPSLSVNELIPPVAPTPADTTPESTPVGWMPVGEFIPQETTIPPAPANIAPESIPTEPSPVSEPMTTPDLQPAGQTLPGTSVEDSSYHAAFEAMSDGVIVTDTMGRMQLVNTAAERILGRSRHELIGQPIGAVYGQIDSGEAIEDLMVAFSRRNQPLPTFISDKDRAIQGRMIPWRNDQSQWMGIIGIFRDITRDVKADRARNDFVAALSHELRAPLTTVKGYTELIVNSALGEYTPKQLRLQRLILSSAERMVEVLDNAIQIITESEDRTLTKFEEVDVIKTINEVLRETAPLAQVRNLKLIHEVKGELPKIAADRRHLRRIIENLVSNACRFTMPGGQVTVRARTQPAHENKMPMPHVLILVSDSGVGIPKEEFERIFTPFYQLKHKAVSEESGMGMGLAVVKELVERHNGRVWVESTVGVGSIFRVALPISQEL